MGFVKVFFVILLLQAVLRCEDIRETEIDMSGWYVIRGQHTDVIDGRDVIVLPFARTTPPPRTVIYFERERAYLQRPR